MNLRARPIELFDLPTLHRYRHRAVYLDATRALIHGNALSAAGFLAHLDLKRRIYTALTEEENPLAGSVIQEEGENFARLVYLAPVERITDAPALEALLGTLIAKAGAWGARQIVAEVDEESPLFHLLRQQGFSVYAWQRIWDLSTLHSPSHAEVQWRKIHRTETSAVRSLHHQIVPPLLQPIDCLDDPPQGILCQTENVEAYIQIKHGTRGAMLYPLIHPEMNHVPESLRALPSSLHEPHAYLCVRSYQAWLEMLLEEMGAQAGPRQALLLKYLAVPLKDEVSTPSTVSVGAQPSHLSRITELERQKRKIS